MDQTLVTSGFDIEIALGERYLQYLLLLALDSGAIPIQFLADDTENPLNDPYTVILTIPSDIDRTYPPNANTSEPAPGATSEYDSTVGFQVAVLFNDPHL